MTVGFVDAPRRVKTPLPLCLSPCMMMGDKRCNLPSKSMAESLMSDNRCIHPSEPIGHSSDGVLPNPGRKAVKWFITTKIFAANRT